MDLIRMSGLPGAGARHYAAKIAEAEVDAGRRVAWLSERGDAPQVAGVGAFQDVSLLPPDIDLLILEAPEALLSSDRLNVATVLVLSSS